MRYDKIAALTCVRKWLISLISEGDDPDKVINGLILLMSLKEKSAFPHIKSHNKDIYNHIWIPWKNTINAF